MLVPGFLEAYQSLTVKTGKLSRTRPNKVARWRPFLNSEQSPIAATTAVAVFVWRQFHLLASGPATAWPVRAEPRRFSLLGSLFMRALRPLGRRSACEFDAR